jgi:Domain of unknown function (DUF4381)
LNPSDPLAALHPLRSPELIGWWPLAPGWWVLLTLAVLALLALGIFIYRRYKANAYRRQALLQLQALHSQWQADADASRYLAALNALLKSVALRAFPEGDCASRSGQSWVDFLNQTLPAKAGCQGFGEDYAGAAYNPSVPELDFDAIYRTSEHWIRQHRWAG